MAFLIPLPQFHTYFFRSIIFLLGLTVFILHSRNTLAEDGRKIEKLRVEKGIQNYKININKLQEGISQKQIQNEASRKQERSILEEMAQIDLKLQEQQKTLDDIEKKVARQQGLIALKTGALEKTLESKQEVQYHLMKRMKAYYKMGKIGVANVTFSTESMPRLLSFRDYFARLIKYDRQILDKYRGAIDQLQQSTEALGLEKTVLDDFILEARQEKEAIRATKMEKEEFLSQVKTQKELHNRAIKEMEKATDSLVASLDNLEQESKLLDQGFLLDKGKHPAPVQGEVIALFGEERENQLGISGNNNGITIKVPGMNRVEAIFDGEIRYAAYLRGYGNTIIVDHGYQYFSVISRVEKILKKKGDKVEQGELIGITGNTATLMGDGVYVEIRHKSSPLDPLDWLDKTGLILP